MTATASPPPVRAARVYLRVSTDEQDLARQEAIVANASARGSRSQSGQSGTPGANPTSPTIAGS